MRRPDGYYETDTVMSNFDKKIDRDVENELKNNECFSQYAGWNFCGYVWYKEDKFYCEVWQYNSYIETVVENSLEEIMATVSSDYGEE